MLKINIKFLLFMIISYIFAYLQGGNLPYYVFYGFLFTFLVGLYCIYVYRKKITANVKFEQRVYRAGDEDVISTAVYNESFIPMPYVWLKNKGIQSFEKDDTGFLFNLKLDENIVLNQNICFKKRGIYKFGEISINLKDIFCVFETKKYFNKDYDIKVYPRLIDIDKHPLKGGDIFKNVYNNRKRLEDSHSARDMRQYRDGDNLKRINWKVSAKYNELYVKEFERVSGREFNLFLDMHNKIYELDLEGNLEEKLVDIAGSLVNYTINKNIKSNVFINCKNNDFFQIQNKWDFERLMEYFLVQFSDGEIDFASYLNGNINRVSSLGGVGIITAFIEDDFTKTVLNLKDRGYVITVFYLGEVEVEQNNINLLKKVGIECIAIEGFVNNDVNSEIG
jgi:hypothetical protein